MRAGWKINVRAGDRNWDREVVCLALSSGLGEGFLAWQWAGFGKLKGEVLLSHSSDETMNVSRSL